MGLQTGLRNKFPQVQWILMAEWSQEIEISACPIAGSYWYLPLGACRQWLTSHVYMYIYKCIYIYTHRYEWMSYICLSGVIPICLSQSHWVRSFSWLSPTRGEDSLVRDRRHLWKEARILLEQRYKRWEDAHLTSESSISLGIWVLNSDITVKLSTYLMAGSHLCLLQDTEEIDVGFVEELGELILRLI